jgi:hypothetical protein
MEDTKARRVPSCRSECEVKTVGRPSKFLIMTAAAITQRTIMKANKSGMKMLPRRVPFLNDGQSERVDCRLNVRYLI